MKSKNTAIFNFAYFQFKKSEQRMNGNGRCKWKAIGYHIRQYINIWWFKCVGTHFFPYFFVFYPCCSFWWFHELLCKTHRCQYERYLYATWIHLHILTIHPYRNGTLFVFNNNENRVEKNCKRSINNNSNSNKIVASAQQQKNKNRTNNGSVCRQKRPNKIFLKQRKREGGRERADRNGERKRGKRSHQ